MSFLDIFNKILIKGKDIDELKIKTTDGMVHKINKDHAVRRFALNIVLVLEGSRLGYRADICDTTVNNMLIKFTLDAHPELMSTPFPESEPLIFLKTNKDKILVITKEFTDGHLCMAKILGYPYIGEDWITDPSKYWVHYQTRGPYGDTNIYSFVIPSVKYTDKIRSDIDNDIAQYKIILESYGFTPFTEVCTHDGLTILENKVT